MRILVITNLFVPDQAGGAAVFSDLCFGLAERGWGVTVYTTHPYYPEWRQKSPSPRWRLQKECIQGVEVWRHRLYVPLKPSKLVGRILYEVSFTASLMRSLFRDKPFDMVMVYCPMPGAVLFAAVRKLLRGERLWLNVQDIPADAAAASGISESGVFNRASGWLQGSLFNRADIWSTISPFMLERLSSLRRHRQPLHFCPNWTHGTLASCIQELPPKIGRVPKETLKLFYSGNIGKKQDLLRFCQELSSTGVRFEFTINGNGSEAGNVRDWVVHSKDLRFRCGELLDEDGFAKALRASDVFIITEKAGSGASFIPSKLIPAIASGTPVLAVCDRLGSLGREMEQAGLGLVLEWNEMAELSRWLTGMIEDERKFVEWQENCVEHSRNYQRDQAIDKFDVLLSSHVRELNGAIPCQTQT